MPYRILFFLFFIMTLVGINACTPEQASMSRVIASPVFDTLQGKWKHLTTTYRPVSPGSSFTLIERDSCEFRSDFIGRDHFPQAYPYTTLNFTYNLLPDDSTLIFNTGSMGNPVYDTVTIVSIHSDYLNYKSKAKTIIIPPSINGSYYVYSVLMR